MWEEFNWDSLLDDLKINENHFLGSIILKYDNNHRYKIDVIDGQQRLTTLSILIKAIYDVSDEQTQKRFFQAVSVILFNSECKSSANGLVILHNIRIQHSKFDKEAYEQVIGTVLIDGSISKAKLKDVNEESHPILRCYNYFVEKLKKIMTMKKEIK